MSVENSTFTSLDGAIDVSNVALNLSSNTFNLNDGEASDAIIAKNVSDLTNIVLSGPNENTFTDTRSNANTLNLSGDVPSDETWNVSEGGIFLDVSAVFVEGTWDYSGSLLAEASGSTPGITIDGGTVNVSDGSILKIQDYGAGGLKVDTHGTLNVNGTESSPVIFTSAEDDSVGGDATGDGPTTGSVGDYETAIVVNGGDVSADYANIEYASIGVNMNTGQANFENTDISNTSYVLQDTNGDITYRGSVTNTTHGIYACNWQGSCNVDAAYVNWGTASGPFPGSDTLACGTVTVSPWTYDGNSYTNHNIFAIPACDSSETPSEQLNDRVTSYQTEVNTLNIDCSNSYEDACDYISAYNSCIQSAWSAAGDNEEGSFTMPDGSPISDPGGYISSFTTALSDFIESEEEGSVTGLAFGVAGQVAGQIGIVRNLNSAYDSCLSAAHNAGY